MALALTQLFAVSIPEPVSLGIVLSGLAVYWIRDLRHSQ
jgi:hypothetical protein